VLDIFPEHENFDNIKKFFRETGDLHGILYTLWNLNKIKAKEQ